MSSVSTLSPLVAARHARIAKAAQDAAHAAEELEILEKEWAYRLEAYRQIMLVRYSVSLAGEMLECANASDDAENIRAAKAHLRYTQLFHEATYNRYKSVVEWLGVEATQ
jgi:hypothetical protein